MENLKAYLQKAKKVLLIKKEEQSFIDKNIKEILDQNFPSGLASKYIKSFQLKRTTLVIETTSKVFAQELFWKKEDLKDKINLSKKLIKEIIIK